MSSPKGALKSKNGLLLRHVAIVPTLWEDCQRTLSLKHWFTPDSLKRGISGIRFRHESRDDETDKWGTESPEAGPRHKLFQGGTSMATTTKAVFPVRLAVKCTPFEFATADYARVVHSALPQLCVDAMTTSIPVASMRMCALMAF